MPAQSAHDAQRPTPDPAVDPEAHALWGRIQSDRPVAWEGMTPFEVVDEIRDWAFTQTLAAASHLLLDRDGDYGVYLQPASEILARMDRREGGFMCGGAASFLRQVYRALGFRSYAVNLGQESTIGTHVVTLVEVGDADGRVLVVEDAYLNWTLVDRAGRAMAWPEAAAAARSGSLDGFVAVAGRSTNRYVMLGSPAPGEINNGVGFAETLARGELVRRLGDDRALYSSSLFTLADFERGSWFRETAGHRSARFGSDSLFWLLGYPLSSSGEREIEELVQAFR